MERIGTERYEVRFKWAHDPGGASSVAGWAHTHDECETIIAAYKALPTVGRVWVHDLLNGQAPD